MVDQPNNHNQDQTTHNNSSSESATHIHNMSPSDNNNNSNNNNASPTPSIKATRAATLRALQGDDNTDNRESQFWERSPDAPAGPLSTFARTHFYPPDMRGLTSPAAAASPHDRVKTLNTVQEEEEEQQEEGEERPVAQRRQEEDAWEYGSQVEGPLAAFARTSRYPPPMRHERRWAVVLVDEDGRSSSDDDDANDDDEVVTLGQQISERLHLGGHDDNTNPGRGLPPHRSPPRRPSVNARRQFASSTAAANLARVDTERQQRGAPGLATTTANTPPNEPVRAQNHGLRPSRRRLRRVSPLMDEMTGEVDAMLAAQAAWSPRGTTNRYSRLPPMQEQQQQQQPQPHPPQPQQDPQPQQQRQASQPTTPDDSRPFERLRARDRAATSPGALAVRRVADWLPTLPAAGPFFLSAAQGPHRQWAVPTSLARLPSPTLYGWTDSTSSSGGSAERSREAPDVHVVRVEVALVPDWGALMAWAPFREEEGRTGEGRSGGEVRVGSETDQQQQLEDDLTEAMDTHAPRQNSLGIEIEFYDDFFGEDDDPPRGRARRRTPPPPLVLQPQPPDPDVDTDQALLAAAPRRASDSRSDASTAGYEPYAPPVQQAASARDQPAYARALRAAGFRDTAAGSLSGAVRLVFLAPARAADDARARMVGGIRWLRADLARRQQRRPPPHALDYAHDRRVVRNLARRLDDLWRYDRFNWPDLGVLEYDDGEDGPGDEAVREMVCLMPAPADWNPGSFGWDGAFRPRRGGGEEDEEPVSPKGTRDSGEGGEKT